MDERRSFWAWWAVWHFLHSYCPGLREWIGVCPWCGRLFGKLHRNDSFCSTLCGVYDQVLSDTDAKRIAAAELLKVDEYVRSHERSRQARFGQGLDRAMVDLSRRMREQLLVPVLSRWADRFVFPRDVTDPHAFRVIWGFLFGQFAELNDRLQVCPVCGRLYWRGDGRMQSCGRDCQLRGYRQRRRQDS